MFQIHQMSLIILRLLSYPESDESSPHLFTLLLEDPF